MSIRELDQPIPNIPGCPPLGKYISRGRDRVVFEHGTNPDWVVKIPRTNPKAKIPTILQNKNEIAVWKHMQDKEDAQWLAKIIEWDEAGQWIVMEKLEEIDRKAYPKKGTFPDWLLDMMSANNWGRNKEGRIVACDYGYDKIVQKLKLDK